MMETEIKRIAYRLEKLGKISDSDKCLSRYYGTKAHKECGDLLLSWMKGIGLEVSKDAIGNIRGILPSSNTNAKHFVIGSHYDTVYNAGKYDGPLGIILGLEMVQRLSDMKKELPFHLNIVAFADEEGSRFNTAYLGSSVIAGNFDKSWLDRKDDDGKTLLQVIEENEGTVKELTNQYIPKEDWLGYFEAHIEQGPVLCKEELPVCLVNGIAAQTRVNVKWEGIAGHAGTSPMNLRNDALCAAAKYTLAIESFGKKHQTELVATIGKFNISPNTSNVIPGMVSHTIDIRSPNDSFLVEILESIKKIGVEISSRRNILFDWKIMQTNYSVKCNESLTEALAKSIKKESFGKLIEIPSGAGHDAVMVSKVAPVSMLFVRCKDGISHNPLEYASNDDIMAALKVCNNFMDELVLSNTIQKK